MMCGGENLDAARNQANSDSNQGLQPAQTHTWDAPVREAYETQFKWNQDQNQNQNR